MNQLWRLPEEQTTQLFAIITSRLRRKGPPQNKKIEPQAAERSIIPYCAWGRTVTWMSASLHPNGLLPYAKQTFRAGKGTTRGSQEQEIDDRISTKGVLKIEIVTTDDKAHL